MSGECGALRTRTASLTPSKPPTSTSPGSAAGTRNLPIFRGDVWLVDLEPVKGHEQGRVRPALIISADKMNQGTSELVVVVPMTTRKRPRHLEKMRVTVAPPEARMPQPSYVMPEHVRSITTDRILKHYGKVSPRTLASVEDLLRIIMNL